MGRCDCECLYCGHKWTVTFWSRDEAEASACPKCKDTSIKIAPHTSHDVYGYDKK